MSRVQDVLGVIRGLQYVAEAGVKLQQESLRQIWANSNLRNVVQEIADQVKTGQVKVTTGQPDVSSKPTTEFISDGVSRVSTVVTGIKEFSSIAGKSLLGDLAASQNVAKAQTTDVSAYKSIEKGKPGKETSATATSSNVNSVPSASSSQQKSEPNFKIKLTPRDRELLKKLDMEHQKRIERTKVDEEEEEVFEGNTLEVKREFQTSASAVSSVEQETYDNVPQEIKANITEIKKNITKSIDANNAMNQSLMQRHEAVFKSNENAALGTVSLDIIGDKEKSIFQKEKSILDKDKFVLDKDKFVLDKDKFVSQKEKLMPEKTKSVSEKTIFKSANETSQSKTPSFNVLTEEVDPAIVTTSKKCSIKPIIDVVPNPKSKLKLNPSAKQRAVPSSRIGRMVSFGTLGIGLGIGTAAQYAKRVVGLESSPSNSNLFLSQGNMDRIVDTLCKVRGAALKLGQIMSIQDESFISPELARALERVRKSADFMPTWQVEKVMNTELGLNWRQKLFEFDDKPFAAASIGQVHWGKTLEKEEVAIKIQYPGVAQGIESDIENLLGIMKVWNLFPKGMFVDNLAAVAKRELAWEVDYLREAECTRKFKELLKPYPEFFVPKVMDDLTSAQVFTTQLVDGIPVDQCSDLEQEERNFIGEKILELCLLELMEFQYMQTDPNWANFLYNRITKQLILLDFGASRAYSKPFMDKYIKIIKAAADDNRDLVLTYSREIGFLTGYESKVMEEAHVDAVMILGEMFRCPGNFDFGVQNTTQRMQHLVPTMIENRLCPPPEEIYSIHRKISGIFLLCLKLKSSICCKQIFENIYSRYKFDS